MCRLRRLVRPKHGQLWVRQLDAQTSSIYPTTSKKNKYGQSHSSSAGMAQAKPNTNDLTSLKKDKKKCPPTLESENWSCSHCFKSSGVNNHVVGTFLCLVQYDVVPALPQRSPIMKITWYDHFEHPRRRSQRCEWFRQDIILHPSACSMSTFIRFSLSFSASRPASELSQVVLKLLLQIP